MLKSNTKFWRGLIATIIIMTALTMSISAPQAQSYGNPGIIPPNAKPYGMSYSEWATKWQQWGLSISKDQNPVMDMTGCANGANGQSGPVWFLAGGFSPIIEGSTYTLIANRDCAVPTGKAIFVPIIATFAYEYLDGPLTPEDLDELVRINFEHITSLEATIDGVEIKNLWDYRAYSPLFQLGPFPANSLNDDPEGAFANAVSDGYFLILTPLSVGTHEIHFRGEAEFTEEQDGFDFKFISDITYKLTVVPGKK